MKKLKIRDTSAVLPTIDPDELTVVSELQNEDGNLYSFSYGGVDLRVLELVRTQLFDGRISHVTAKRADMDRVRMSSVEFTDCDLASLVMSASRLSRVRFENCRLLGARCVDLVLDNVVFEGCRFDYATFRGITAQGPVIFIGCSFVESEFIDSDLSGAVFEDCALRATSFLPGHYRGTDLRGNDVSQISGAVNLRRVVVDRPQLVDLSFVLVNELGITVADGE